MRDERTGLAGGIAIVWIAIVCISIVWATLTMAAAQDPGTPGFRPEEISIGEPLALPFGGQNSGPAGAAPSAAAPARDGVTPEIGAADIGLPGSGWLGLSVAESSVPGRWQIDQVVPGGPAGRAGIRPGDELRAINGLPLTGSEELSAVMTAIASGQNVRVAIARNDDLQELVLKADPRPPVAAARTQPPPLEAGPPSFNPGPPSFTATPPPAMAAAPVPALAPAVATPTGGFTNPWTAGATAAGATAESATAEGATAEGATAEGESWGGSRRDERRLDAPGTVSVATGGRIALGVRTLPIDSVTQSRFNLSEPAGAYVFGVVEDLPASRAGVPPGSVIVALDGRPVRSPGELTQLVTAGPLDRPVTLQFVLPGGESRRASVELQSLTAPVVEALAGPEAAASIPTLEPGPRRAERPLTGSRGNEHEAAIIREEVRLLRQRLERLERRLESVEPTLRR